MKMSLTTFAGVFICAGLLSCTQNLDTENVKKSVFSHIKHTEMIPVSGAKIMGQDVGRIENFKFTNQTFQEGRNVELDSFCIGKYEVTYELWYEVHTKAELSGYKFKNKGRAGTIAELDNNDKGKYVIANRAGDEPEEKTKTQPVTAIAWVDAIVWCNAYSELSGKTPVYYNNDGEVLKDSNNFTECLAPVVKRNNNGYRLPTNAEWEFAARGGNQSNADAWGTGLGFAGTQDTNLLKEYAEFNCESTKPVGSLKPNVLDLYDMCGNISEFCFDLYSVRIRVDEDVVENNPDHPKSISYDTEKNQWDEFDRASPFKSRRGGSWSEKNESQCAVGEIGLTIGKTAKDNIGFRVVTK